MDIEHLFRSNSNIAKVLQKPGHEARIIAVGWGEPPTYYTECTCGWRGHVIESFVPELLIAPLREFGETHGWESLLNENEIYGTGDDAAREVLGHLGLPLDEMLKKHHSTLKEIFDDLSRAELWSEKINNAEKIEKLARELTVLLTVKEFLTSHADLPQRKSPFDPELYARYRKILSDHLAANQSRQEGN